MMAMTLLLANILYSVYVVKVHVDVASEAAALRRAQSLAARTHSTSTSTSSPIRTPSPVRGGYDEEGKTLVVYAYYENTDMGYRDNLLYFLEVGVFPSPLVDFVIVVSGDHTLDSASIANERFPRGGENGQFPRGGENIRWVTKPNECFDFGAYALGLAEGRKTGPKGGYTKYVLINSSVRGPFTPTYVPTSSWVSALTARVTGRVKLVGTSINCQCYAISDEHPPSPAPAASGGNNKNESNKSTLLSKVWTSMLSLTASLLGEASPNTGGSSKPGTRCVPHVQSMVLATDNVGIRILEEAGVFECHSSLSHVVYYSEIGSSKAIFDAGYDIGSLLLKYEASEADPDFSWRALYASGSAGCNRGTNPTLHSAYDGMNLHPLETMFIKAKRGLSPGYETMSRISRFAHALSVSASSPLGKAVRDNNVLVDDPAIVKAIKTALKEELDAADSCSLTFDDEFYFSANHDVAQVGIPAYDHWIRDGFVEGRRFRWKQRPDKDGDIVSLPRHCEPYIKSHMFHGLKQD